MKILASDLDGTIVFNRTEMLEKDLNAINILRKNNVKFVISTGRGFKEVKDLIHRYNLKYDYLSLCNGGLVLDKDNNVVLDRWVPNRVYKNILKDYYNYNDSVISCDDGNSSYIVWKNELKSVDELSYLNFPFKRISIEDAKAINSNFRMICLFTFSKDCTWASKVKKEVLNKYGDYVEAYRNQCYIDVVPSSCSKGNALLKILDIEKSNINDLYTIGDSLNDLSMIKITPNGYTFNRADEEMKKYTSNKVDNFCDLADIILSK